MKISYKIFLLIIEIIIAFLLINTSFKECSNKKNYFYSIKLNEYKRIVEKNKELIGIYSNLKSIKNNPIKISVIISEEPINKKNIKPNYEILGKNYHKSENYKFSKVDYKRNNTNFVYLSIDVENKHKKIINNVIVNNLKIGSLYPHNHVIIPMVKVPSGQYIYENLDNLDEIPTMKDYSEDYLIQDPSFNYFPHMFIKSEIFEIHVIHEDNNYKKVTNIFNCNEIDSEIIGFRNK